MFDVFRGVIEGERWDVIAGGNYAISDHGRFMRTSPGKGGLFGVIVKLKSNGKYPCVAICVNGKKIYRYVHRLVMASFAGECPAKYEVNHKDGNRLNNVWTNLEYTTPIENKKHALDSGLNKCKLTEAEVLQIREKIAAGMSLASIGRQHGCSGAHVSRIKHGKSRLIKWSRQ